MCDVVAEVDMDFSTVNKYKTTYNSTIYSFSVTLFSISYWQVVPTFINTGPGANPTIFEFTATTPAL
jgi:hypothetical protein